MQNEYKVKAPLSEEERHKLREYSDELAHLLFHRGLREMEEAKSFISPDFSLLYDPFLLSDMEKTAELIISAIKENKRICIFSDYDADGIPGAVVLHDFFKMALFENFFNYIPDRSEEGFGLSTDAIDKIKEEGAEILITIDCGVCDISQVSYANEKGIVVVITDHHIPSEQGLPDAFAIVNPKISPNYPDQMLCGCAVAFKVVQAVLLKERFGIPQSKEKWLLDMVGIATLSDMVPLQNENRVFAYYGLVVLQKSRRIGLQKLIKKLKLNQANLSEDDIGFMITPRINAASRMGISMDAFRLLTTENEDIALELVKKLEEANNERKGTTAYIVKEVRKMIEAKYSPYYSNKVIVAGSPTWKPSVLGLVASSIAEKEMKPVFLWGRDGSKEELKGSCRGVKGVSVVSIMSGVPEGVFVNFGGHHLAGGFSVSYDAIHTLDEEIEKAFTNSLQNKEEVSGAIVDFVYSTDEMTDKLLTEIEKLSPFGIGNEKPSFLLKNAKVSSVSFFGKEKNHLKVILERKGRPLSAIAFFAPENLVKKVKEGESFSFVGHLERDFFGTNSIRFRILDIGHYHI